MVAAVPLQRRVLHTAEITGQSDPVWALPAGESELIRAPPTGESDPISYAYISIEKVSFMESEMNLQVSLI